MSGNGATLPQDSAATDSGFTEVKGKGKAPTGEVREAAMDEDDDDDDDEDDDEDEEDEGEAEVSFVSTHF
jgi:hypothetical protein